MGTIKPWEELSFQDDYMFKRVMSHKRFCKRIKNIKGQESERVSYMTYAMKIQEERDEAKAEGRTEGKVEDIKSLAETTGWAIEKVLEALKIPSTEWDQYKLAIQG